jgi:hypothetical protein
MRSSRIQAVAPISPHEADRMKDDVGGADVVDVVVASRRAVDGTE